MITIAEYNRMPIPDYALSYLINDDDSGITSEDKQNIDSYMEQYYQEAGEGGGSVIISIEDSETQEARFTIYPEFGLACNVYDCTILIVK